MFFVAGNVLCPLAPDIDAAACSVHYMAADSGQPKLGVALLSTPDDFIAIPRPLPVASTVSPVAHGPVTSFRAVRGYPGTISSMDKHA